jgi:hypothetical protein
VLAHYIAPCIGNCVSGVMVNVFASSVIDHVFKPRLGLTKDYKIDISCFSAKHTALRSKNKDYYIIILRFYVAKYLLTSLKHYNTQEISN